MKKELDEDLEEDEEENEEEAEESEFKEELEKSDEPTLDLDFNNLDFSQFTPFVDADSGSPVLESIESRIDRPGFVQMGTGSGVSGSSLDSGSGRDDTYLPDQSGGDGPKYIQSEGEVGTNVGRVDMQNLGRGVGGFNIPQSGNFFITSEQGFQSRNVEQVGMQPERIDLQNVGRKNPLEREEKKYEEHKKYEFDPSK